jgi:tRNA pseudouridine55 synthase
MFGLLNIAKPAGWTSRDVVNRVARLVGRGVKVGHAGTLDPLATGVLVVCIGPATRLVPWIHEHSKSYLGTFLLGQQSDTDDVDGQLEPAILPADLRAEHLTALLPEFVGEIQQVPPAYSAVKVQGRRAYALAREGQAVELTARCVTVSRLELVEFESPRFVLSITCGTGTYIRSIGRDLAQRLGSAAVMSALVRTSVGPFRVEDSIDPTSLTRDQLEGSLQSPLVMLNHLAQLHVEDGQEKRLRWGQSLSTSEVGIPAGASDQSVAIVAAAGRLLAIGHVRQGRIAPQIVFPMKE